MSPVEIQQPLALRPRDAAKVLGISPRLLWDLTAPRGPIPVVRVGGGRRKSILYPVAELRVWLEQHALKQGGEQ